MARVFRRAGSLRAASARVDLLRAQRNSPVASSCCVRRPVTMGAVETSELDRVHAKRELRARLLSARAELTPEQLSAAGRSLAAQVLARAGRDRRPDGGLVRLRRQRARRPDACAPSSAAAGSTSCCRCCAPTATSTGRRTRATPSLVSGRFGIQEPAGPWLGTQRPGRGPGRPRPGAGRRRVRCPSRAGRRLVRPGAPACPGGRTRPGAAARRERGPACRRHRRRGPRRPRHRLGRRQPPSPSPRVILRDARPHAASPHLSRSRRSGAGGLGSRRR